MPKFFNVLVVAQALPSAWGIMCLKHDVDEVDVHEHIHLDGVDLMLVAWALKEDSEFPIYLQVTEMSRSKQMFALSTAFHSFREQGYQIESS